LGDFPLTDELSRMKTIKEKLEAELAEVTEKYNNGTPTGE